MWKSGTGVELDARSAAPIRHGGDIPILWRTSADVAQESSSRLLRACQSATFDSSAREAARCHTA